MENPTKPLKKNKNFSFMIKFLLSATFCAVLSYLVLNIFHLYDGILAVILLSILFTSIFSFLLRTRFLTLITAASAGGIALIAVLLYLVSKSARDSISGYYDWLYQNIRGNVIVDQNYSSLTVIFVSLVVAALCYIIFIKIRSFFIPFLFNIVILMLIGIHKPNTSVAVIFVITFYLVVFGFLSVYNNLRKSKIQANSESSFFILFIIMISLVALLITTVLPKSEKPLNVKWLDEISNYLYYATTVINKSNDNLFYFAYHIKSDDLDGNAYPDDLKVLSVVTSKPEYLKYSVKDKYTGFSWVDTNRNLLPLDDKSNEMQMSLYEMQNGFKFLNPGETKLADFTYNNDLMISFERIIANFLFTPVNVSGLQAGLPDLSVSANSIIFMKDRQKRNFTYSLSSNCIDYGNGKLINLLRKSKIGLYENVKSDGQTAQLTLLKQRAEKVKSVYLQLPAKLPSRVKELAKEITGSSSNNYDKVKTIETYLAETMNYTLSPPKRSSNRDLVDFFLFDSHQGYCTSYASAMTVMVRSIGIPARYCEGYVMPKQDPTDTAYVVTNKEAHAWCEVYFEGFGWVPFEATKTMRNEFYNNASFNPTQPEIIPTEEPVGENDDESGIVSEDNGEAEISEESSTTSEVDTGRMGDISSILILSIIILSLLIIVAILVKCIRNDRRIKRMFVKAQFGIPRDGIISMYRYYVGALTVLNIKRSDSETPYEFYERIKNESSFLTTFQEITEAFVEARYNPAGSHASTQKDVYLYNTKFQKFLHEHMNKLEYYYYHYYLGVV